MMRVEERVEEGIERALRLREVAAEDKELRVW
jgi:hypothetical protein